jgi:hypothetical protein
VFSMGLTAQTFQSLFFRFLLKLKNSTGRSGGGGIRKPAIPIDREHARNSGRERVQMEGPESPHVGHKTGTVALGTSDCRGASQNE